MRCLGWPTTWITSLPANPLGRMISRQAEANGVDTSAVQWVDEESGRAGVYFLEEGVDPRPSAITYDRKDTAIALVKPGTFDWNEIPVSYTHLRAHETVLDLVCR